MKEVETTCTLLASIRSSCGDFCPEVLADYDNLMRSPSLSLQALEQVRRTITLLLTPASCRSPLYPNLIFALALALALALAHALAPRPSPLAPSP